MIGEKHPKHFSRSNGMTEAVLITGGCGFVGMNLTALLNEKGDYSVRIYDNETIGKRRYLEGLDAEFIHGDLRDRKSLDKALCGVDCVVHLAADTSVMDSIENASYNFDVNVRGTFTLLSAMLDKGMTRIVNASTGGAIIGEAEPPVHEDMLPLPVSPYGASKLAVEGYLSAFCRTYDFEAVSLRFSNIYGPRSFHKGSVVAHFMKRILEGKELVVYGDGSQNRDYIYVADICQGILSAMRCKVPGVFQLGSGRPTTINQLIAYIRDVVGPAYPVSVRHEDFRPGEIRNTYCSISKAKKFIGFSPSMPLDDGLLRTWHWFLQNR
jgi:UDP-glucose 4-epimerase